MPCWAFYFGLPPGNCLPCARSEGHVGPIVHSARGGRKYETLQGSSGNIPRGAASPRFGKLPCQGEMPGSVPGMQAAPWNLPRPCGCDGAGSHCAKHDLAGSAGGKKCFDVTSASWNYSLLGSSSGEIRIAGRRLRDSRATGGCRTDAACLPTPAMCHHPRSHCTFIPWHLLPPYYTASLLSARRGPFSPSSSSAKLFVWWHLLLSPHLILA